MNVWAKVLTALRGSVNEAGEARVDNQALRILDQEVREAADELKLSKQTLAEMMAKEKVASNNEKKIQLQIKDYERYVVKALEKKDEALALEVAGNIAELENQLAGEQSSSQHYFLAVTKLKTAISFTERNIKLLKQQVDTVKATESVQRAQAAVAERHGHSHSRLRTAMDSLDKIKQQQALKEATLDAASELAEDNAETRLMQKLMDAGIAPQSNKAEDILQKIKNKR
ncbi:MAG: PspA/IM30 family protein [Pseudomonadales bacterium]|nr:PspA/IM30 family protein [Pseudomonadales bacterium]